MAQTFDIRFARSGGLAGFFETPANSFRWKGGGRLSVDAEGISVAVKRSVASLLLRHRSQRIPAQHIKEVYREGESLRVEFVTDENPRAVLPFWARDRDTAARIVELLPTSRTIEFEHSTNAPSAANGRRSLVLATVIVFFVGSVAFLALRQAPPVENPAIVATAQSDAVVAAAAAVSGSDTGPLTDQSAPVPSPASNTGEPISADEARKLAMLAEDPVDWTSPPPKFAAPTSDGPQTSRRNAPAVAIATEPPREPEAESFVPDEVPAIRVSPAPVTPIPSGTLAYDAARSLVRRFIAGTLRIQADFIEASADIKVGRFNSEEDARRLNEVAAAWRALGRRLLNGNEVRDPELGGLRAALAGVVSYQSSAYDTAALAVRAKNPELFKQARQDLQNARALMESARQYSR